MNTEELREAIGRYKIGAEDLRGMGVQDQSFLDFETIFSAAQSYLTLLTKHPEIEGLQRKAEIADELAQHLSECLDNMEAGRASGDCGFWDWDEDSVYTKSLKVLLKYKELG